MTRTRDLLITSEMHYRLCYTSMDLPDYYTGYVSKSQLYFSSIPRICIAKLQKPWYNPGNKSQEVITLRKLLKYMKGYTRECVLGPLFKLLEATFELFIPLVVADIVDKGIGSGDGQYVIRMCDVMIALGIIGLVCAVTAQFFAAKAAVGFSTRLRHAVMAHILSLSYTEIDTLGTSTLVTRMTSDINQVQNGINLTLRLLLRSPFVVFGAMIMAFTIDVQAALVFAGVIPALCLVVFGIMLVTMPMYKKVQQKLDRVTSDTRQNLSGVRVLRAFTMEQQEVEEFSGSTRSLQESQQKAGRISNLMNPITLVLVNLAVILVIRTGAVKVYEGVLTQGLVIALYNYMTQILVELVKMANLIISMTKAAACAGRIAGILEISPSQTDGDEHPEQLCGKVEFRNVTARYAGAAEPSLEGISFTAQPGQTIGIIGGTGSGKTTLVNLIPRLYDAAGGTVRIDDRDVCSFDMNALRSAIAVVPQKSVLFKGTIRQNLLWGNPDADDSALWEALEIAQAREVVKSKEGELSAQVEQGGSNFSGGQRQRLAIARALVRKPAILILDDSASALDYATDARLRTAIRGMHPSPTTFIVSQRAASVRYADQIIVLDDGEMVGIGTHDTLLQTCAVYQEVYYSQFPREVKNHG